MRLATEKATGNEFACKSIRKRLDVAAGVPPAKQQQHLDNIKREVRFFMPPMSSHVGLPTSLPVAAIMGASNALA